MNKQYGYLDHLQEVADKDVEALLKAQLSYGDSWKKRGGVGAFMMLARKWDRLENQVQKSVLVYRGDGVPALGVDTAWDIFKHAQTDTRPEGIIDDIRDLRRYLLLVEAHLVSLAAEKTSAAPE